MKLVSMKNPPAEKNAAAPAMDKVPEYPWGLRIHLDQAQLDALGIKELPKVGAVMTVQARVEVCDTAAHEHQEGGSHKSVGLQITDMALNTKRSDDDVANALYKGGKK